MKYALFNRFELPMPEDSIDACHHQGACDADVDFWAEEYKRPDNITADMIRDELKEYGAWNEIELADDQANWKRILWLGAGNIQDEEFMELNKEE